MTYTVSKLAHQMFIACFSLSPGSLDVQRRGDLLFLIFCCFDVSFPRVGFSIACLFV